MTYSEDALRENIGAFTNALLLAKPAGLKKSKWYLWCICILLFTGFDKMVWTCTLVLKGGSDK